MYSGVFACYHSQERIFVVADRILLQQYCTCKTSRRHRSRACPTTAIILFEYQLLLPFRFRAFIVVFSVECHLRLKRLVVILSQNTKELCEAMSNGKRRNVIPHWHRMSYLERLVIIFLLGMDECEIVQGDNYVRVKVPDSLSLELQETRLFALRELTIDDCNKAIDSHSTRLTCNASKKQSMAASKFFRSK